MSDFETLISGVLKREGGYVNNPADRGGETNFGISKRANPDVDVKNLTVEGAKALYKSRYWDAVKADSLPAELREVAFDTAVHHGVGQANKWLALSGGDKAALLSLRKSALQEQAKQPGQAQFLKGWMNRVEELGAGTTPVAAPLPQARSYSAAEFEAQIPDLSSRRQVATENAILKQEIRPSWFVQLGAAIAGNQDNRIADVVRSWRDEFPAEAGFQVPDEAIRGQDSYKATRRLKAKSNAELQHIIKDQDEDDDRLKVLMADGTGKGVATMFAGELLAVSNWVAPWAAARTMGGRSIALAQQGRKGAALGASFAENAAAGTALELGLQTAEGHYDPANLLLAASVDMVAGGVQTAALNRSVGLSRVTQGVLEREAALMAKVDQTLGASATPEMRGAEYQRLRAAEIKQPLEAAASPVPTSRQLMERPDEVGESVPVSADRQSTGSVTDNTLPGFKSMEQVDESFGRQARWENPALTQNRIMAASRNDGDNEYGQIITKMTEGDIKTYQQAASLPPGVHLSAGAARDKRLTKVAAGLKSLAAEYLPADATLVLGRATANPKARGEIVSVGRVHMIGLKPDSPIIADTSFHELGHAVFNQWAKAIPESLIDRINAEFLEFTNKALDGDRVARDMRFSGNNPEVAGFKLGLNEYNMKRDEWFAENFVKHLQQRIAKQEPGLDKGLIDRMIDGIKQMFAMFIKAKRLEVITPASSVEEFARAVLARNTVPSKSAPEAGSGPVAQASTAADSVNSFLTDPIAVKYGLGMLPVSTSSERADAKALLNLYKKADEWSVANPMDEAWVKRADQLIDNSLLPAASTGLRLLKSQNPVARMIASELLEDASGVAGAKKSTAAISKYLHERKFMGNTINDVQNAYELWAKERGGGMLTELTDKGAMRSRFNSEVAAEIESRRVQQTANVTKDGAVKLAADSLQGAYDRIRSSQIANKTLGYQALWETSLGYMPHKISPNKWLALGNGERQVLHQALTDQFITIEGWDLSFSDALASRYLERVQARATGGHDSPIGGASSGSAEIIEDALLAAGMSRDEVRKNMQKFNRGAATWTRGRIDLDLNKEYVVDGKQFKLLDVFDTDQIGLLRSQAGRGSGEVALARHGVYGKPGLTLLRKAMGYGADGARATDQELGAFDQIAAEFVNAPFGTAEPKWMENTRVLNSVVRLGGIVFNQFAEFVNGVAHVGVLRTIDGVASMGRLRGEIKALAKGDKIDNSLLESIEKLGGAEFGTDVYKIVMPFDTPDHAYPTYGNDTIGNFDRLLRGASYAQGKLSLWRTVHSVQQRGMAEQIVAKIARYSQAGKEDVALRQFGVSEEVQKAIKADGVARWEGDSLVEFDVTKMKDPALREELIQSVHRGVNQIIQGTFIGETGKWAHEGYLKMLTQFRTFSLTSMEKQWARQRNSRGTAQALGILLGSMGAVIPVYVARVYAQSVGREDQQEYIDKRLDWQVVARQTLNYVAMAGLAGDFLDAAGALAPDELGLKAMGGNRSGVDTDFVGNVVAPALSLVDDGWKALQNLDDPEKLSRILPGSRLPYVLPAINALGD